MRSAAGFPRDFILVVLGQVISLFGNAILHFALPLYLLRETGSSALFGAVTACSFLPLVLMAPMGGAVADRVNKRTMMAGLDFLLQGWCWCIHCCGAVSLWFPVQWPV